jgi:hypothetical protein
MNTIIKPFIVGALAFVATTATATDFYVATNGNDSNPGTLVKPFATLERARDAIRELKKSGPLKESVNVRLQGGTYALAREVRFGPEDSGIVDCPITYTAAGAEPVVVGGGRRITGWQKYDGKLWVANLPDVAAGQWKFRQLFVNGQQRVLARIPNAGYLRVDPAGNPKTGGSHQMSQKFQFAPGDIRTDWLNLTNVEVVVYHYWTDSHMLIKSVDTRSNIVTFAYPDNKVFSDDNTTNGARYIVENVFEGLDAPGEWYLNRHTGQLFYYPLPGEDLAKVEVIAPFAPALVRLEGDPAKRRFVEHLRFRNLGFAYSRFELPFGDSNGRQGSASVSAAINLRGARSCAFEQCRIFNLGTFAFDVKEGCSDNQFVGNEIVNVAAGGFRVNGGTEKNPPWERTRNNRITDNWLHNYGLDYTSAVGVFLLNTDGNTVSHNQIDHGGYTGISVGMVYGYARSVSQNNLIEFNHIHHIGGVLSDMGGIYTLGISPGTIIRNNLIHDVDAHSYGGWGIYHDEGSTHLLDENNVVYNTKFAPFDIHFAQEVTVRNNIFALGKMDQLSRTKVEPHKSVYLENNIVYWREGELFSGNWKDVPYATRVTVLGKTTFQQTTNTFDCDWNLYFNPTQKLDEVKFNGDTWTEWRQRGKDAHSLYADPLFVAPEQGDFTIKPESPAFSLGFQAIDLSQVGPRFKTGPQHESQ